MKSYCIKCKQKNDIMNAKLVYYKSGTPAWSGTCQVCGTNVSGILTRQERMELKAKQIKEGSIHGENDKIDRQTEA